VIKPRPFLVAIVGGSGSGKSWLAERLEKSFAGRAARLSLDDFYRDRSRLPPARRAKINFDNPAAIDWLCFRSVLVNLSKGKSARLPEYDFTSHSRKARWRTLQPKQVVIVDGLWLLRSPALRRLFDQTIFLDCCEATRLSRRLARDLKTRGRTERSVREQFQTTVQPMHAKFVQSQRKWADIVIEENFSPQQVTEIGDGIQKLADPKRPFRGR
jgi:uridine kinase